MWFLSKRFKVYYWKYDSFDDFYEDNDEEIEDALEQSRVDIMDYGSLVGETNDENEARKIAKKNIRLTDRFSKVAIYDKKKKIWLKP